MLDFLLNNWQAIFGVGGVLSAVVSWVNGRSKRDSTALEALQSNYKLFVLDHKEKLTELLSEVKELRTENAELKKLVETLTEEIDSLRGELAKYKPRKKIQHEIDFNISNSPAVK